MRAVGSMKRSVQRLLSVAVAALLVPHACSAASVAFVKGKATVVEQMQSEKITVTMRTSKPTKCNYKPDCKWGDEGGDRQTFLTAIDVASGGVSISLPSSAYADLWNPQKASVTRIAFGFALTITGGDAATAYEAVLEFENGKFMRKYVSSRASPTAAWEETRYAW